MKRLSATLVGTSLFVSACQHYAPVPLAEAPPLRPAVDPAQSAAPLTVDDVVRLALRDNPGLEAARAARGVADAELIQSGILPDPSLSGAFLPLISGVGVVSAWNAAVSQDIRALITYRSKKRAARDVQGRAAADLLWQEWQVAGQARQLAIDLIGTRRLLPIAQRGFAILSARNDVMQAALRAGDTTLVLAAPSLAAVQAAHTSRDAAEQRALQLSHQLAALLGLVPDAPLVLTPVATLPPFDPDAIRASLTTLPRRRPDLLALRLGYGAQEEAVRQAILSQFPDLVLGGAASSDSSKVINLGPQASIGIPVFDRGQGNIAIARATRAQLRAEYAARIATATGEVAATLTEMDQLSRQLAAQRAELPTVRRAADHAVAARGASAIDEAAYVSLISARFTKEQDVLTLELALMDRQIALQTLVGAGLPTVDLLPMTEAVR